MTVSFKNSEYVYPFVSKYCAIVSTVTSAAVDGLPPVSVAASGLVLLASGLAASAANGICALGGVNVASLFSRSFSRAKKSMNGGGVVRWDGVKSNDEGRDGNIEMPSFTCQTKKIILVMFIYRANQSTKSFNNKGMRRPRAAKTA